MEVEPEEFLATDLRDVAYEMKSRLIEILDENDDNWKDFLAELPEDLTNYLVLSERELKQRSLSCENGMWKSPAALMINKLELAHVTVSHLITWLEAIHLENALTLFKPDEPLSIIEEPDSELIVEEGGLAQLTCRAQGFPTPYYQWFKDGQEILHEQMSQLRLDEAKPQDRGTYVCQVYTLDRKTRQIREPILRSTPCHVRILAPFPVSAPPARARPPEIIHQPKCAGGSLIQQGTPVILQCIVIGDGPMTYKWFKNRSQIPGG